MRLAHTYTRKALLVMLAIGTALVGTGVLTAARSNNAIDITVTNSSQQAILHVYLAAGDPNNWGPDQLNGSTIQPGSSHQLTDVSCNGTTIRVIAEDERGCFVYANITCDANQNWEITENTPRDCGD